MKIISAMSPGPSHVLVQVLSELRWRPCTAPVLTDVCSEGLRIGRKLGANVLE